MVRTLGLTLGVAVLGGCHTYAPVTTPAPGSIVRVQVPVSSALDGPNAAARTVSVEGQVVSAGETLLLAMESRQEYGAYREVVQFDTLSLSASQVSLIEVREFSAPRSVLMGAIIAAGAVTAGVVAFNSAKNGGNPPTPPPPPPSNSIVINRSIISTIWGLLGN